MSEPGFFHVIGRYFKFCWGRILVVLLISTIVCSVTYSYGPYANFKEIKVLVNLLYDKFIDLVIFLPSIAFVMFGLLPSIGRNLKIRLIEKGEHNSRKIEGVLDDLAVVFYLSVIGIGLSICVKMLWGLMPDNLDTSLTNNTYTSFVISTFVIGTTLLVLIVERIWMTIYLVHSILLGDFSAIENDFKDTFDLLSASKIDSELMDEAARQKIIENLSASSIKKLKKD